MRVVILGAGRVGFNIARYIATSENDVTVVDLSHDLLKRISDLIDIQPILGHASHPDVLLKAGVMDADLLIALTGSDEVNIVACEVANTLYRVPKKIARIGDQSYLEPSMKTMFGKDRIAIDHIISPEVEVAKNIARSLRVIGAFDVKSFWDGDIKIVGVRCHHSSIMLNTPLRMLPNLFPRLEFLIACIYRDNELFIPRSEDQILLNDEIYLVGPTNQIDEIMIHFHHDYDVGKRAVIIGGGNIGLALALELENELPDMSVKVIEYNPKRAEYIARQLQSTEVLCGDGLDVEVLREANIQETEIVVTITEDDQVNILGSLLSKREGALRSMTLLNVTGYSSLVSSLGIDAIISPHDITVSSILQYIRRGQIHSVYSLREGQLEIIEAEAQEDSNIIGLAIEDIIIKGKILVAALYHDDQISVMIPPKTIICIGDRLLLIVAKDTVSKVEKLFSTRPVYLS